MTKRNRLIAAAIAAVVIIAVGVVLLVNSLTEVDAEALSAELKDKLVEVGPLPDMILGQEDAPVTIIEYASLTCPHCGLFHREVMQQVKEEYIDTGKVRWIFREFPFDQFATAGFMLARCAEPEKYFGFIDVLFAEQDDWMEDPNNGLRKIARRGGFTNEEIDACIQDTETFEGIKWIQTRGREEFGVNSTPTFFINGLRVRGAPAFEAFSPLIEEQLEASSADNSGDISGDNS